MFVIEELYLHAGLDRQYCLGYHRPPSPLRIGGLSFWCLAKTAPNKQRLGMNGLLYSRWIRETERKVCQLFGLYQHCCRVRSKLVLEIKKLVSQLVK